MLRAIIGVVVAYIVIAVVLGVGFTLLYLALGTEGAYKPGSWEVSTLWVSLSIPIGIVAALAGGFICRLIAGRRGPVLALAVVVAVLGAGEAVFQVFLKEHTDEPRVGEVATFEAAGKSRQPAWVALANPVIGVVGVLLGGGALTAGAGAGADRERVARDAADEARGGDTPDDDEPTS